MKQFLFILAVLLSIHAFGTTKDGNQDWSFISPRRTDIVKSGELLVVAQVDTALEVIPASVEVFIDEVMVNTRVKLTNHRITLLYMFPLTKGKHSLELKGKTQKYGWLDGILTEFTVGIPSSGVVDESG